MEDRWARDFLRKHARDNQIDFEFLDYSVKEPFESRWKSNVRERLARTRGTIVLVGPTTWRSDAVKWEIDETIRQGHPLFGIQIHTDSTHRVPRGLPTSRVIKWDFRTIRKELARW